MRTSHPGAVSPWKAVIRLLVVWLIVIPVVHGLVPWALSTRMRRHGWATGSPGAWNWIGLVPVALAVSLLSWVRLWKSRQGGAGARTARVQFPNDRTALFLMERGPYGFTRNPMYIAYLALWFGWAIFFGSIGVLVGSLVLCLVASLVIVPKEERDLAATFGDSYVRYKNRVPRWFSLPYSAKGEPPA